MRIFVVNLSALLQDLLLENEKQFVKVPKTYQNIFSISSGFVNNGLNVCFSENTKGKIPIRYMAVIDNQTDQ